MKTHTLGAAGMLMLSTTIAAYSAFGGWAVVKVSKVPDAWVAGKPLQLSWQVRQHGVTPLGAEANLRPTLEARSGSRVVHGTAAAYTEEGWKGFRGTIVFPTTGEWQVTINSGFGDARAVLLPWRVVDSVRAIRGTVEEHVATLGVARFSEVERGRRLFVSQGCVSCHVHRAVEITGQMSTFGPELSDRRLSADYLAKFLANPAIKPATAGTPQMPNLDLREKEIIPLVAFLTAARPAATR
jgi:mono/diheme cytochrome c family protein